MAYSNNSVMAEEINNEVSVYLFNI